MSASSTRLSTPMSTPRPTANPQHISHPAHKLLARVQPDQEAATKVFTDKILHKPLLLSASTDHTTDKRALRRRVRLHRKAYALKHARPKPLSAKEKRKLGLYELRPEECKYEIYQGLNRLWRRYILEVLGYVNRDGKVMKDKAGNGLGVGTGGGALMANADFHGMKIEVVRSKDVGRVGLKGIVVRETRSTITVVCNEKEESSRLLRKQRARQKLKAGAETSGRQQDGTEDVMQDKVRMILKKGTIFRVVIDLPHKGEEVEGVEGPAKDQVSERGEIEEETTTSTARRQLIFELHGDQLEVRPIERAVKKFKWRPMDYL